MDDLESISHYTEFYRCPDDIENFKIRIKIRELKKIEKESSLNNWIEKEFNWQEKHFSKTQKEYYREQRNCFTEVEKQFHTLIRENEENEENIDDDLLFCYINNENFQPEDRHINLNLHYSKLTNALNANGNISDDELEYNFHKSIVRSIENPYCNNTNSDIEYMFLMADFGEYFRNIWIKNEKLLCQISYNNKTKVLSIFPDFSMEKPYKIKICGEKDQIFHYFIEHASNSMPETIEMEEKKLINKINEYKTLMKTHIPNDSFKIPPPNKLYMYFFMEIITGENFEYPDIYVQYYIDLPAQWYCENKENLKGRTQLCRNTRDNSKLHFGHCIELLLEYHFMGIEATERIKSPYIYFEVISKGSWNRYRTEGLCYMNLPVYNSGLFEYNLNCVRFTTAYPSSEMRRFFIGDCQNYNDITWIGFASDYEEKTLNKYGTHTISTGQLNVRFNVVHQSKIFLNTDRKLRKTMVEKLETSALIKSVEEVIAKFRRARKRMTEVTDRIVLGNDDE